MFIYNNDYDVLTDSGFQDFEGIKITEKNSYLHLKFSDESELECTYDHLIKINDIFIPAKELEVGDIIKDDIILKEKIEIKKEDNKKEKFYDLYNVSNGHEYITNNITSHNCAFIPKEKWEPFWTSSYPTISSSRSAKIIMSSTPRGLNHFYKLWTDAENNKNGFKTFKVTWKDVPYYDKAWAIATKKEMEYDRNPAKFDAEYNCEFRGSAGTLITGAKLEQMPVIDPIETRYDDKLKIYKYPKNDRKYVLFADFAEGDGQNYTVAQIVDVTELPWKQVAVYRDNEILVGEIPLILDKLGKYYNEALIVGETNSIGVGILDDLNYDLEYENLFFGDRLASGKLSKYFGIKTTSKSKRIGNSYLKEYVENDSIEIVDYDTIGELNTYIKQKNGTYAADEGEMDDTVLPLILFSYFMQHKVYVDEWLNTSVHNRNEEREKKIEEELVPIGFYSDGDELIDLEADDDDEYDDGLGLDWLNFI